MRKVPKWGQTANYPAGTDPWSGQPTKVDPGTDVFTPGQDAGAPYVNFLLRRQTIEAIQAAQVSAMGSPWIGGFFAAPGAIDACYSPGTRGWLAVGLHAGNYDIDLIRNPERVADAHEYWRANTAPPSAPEKIHDFGDAVVLLCATGNFQRLTSGGITTPAGVAGTHWDFVCGLGIGTSSAFAVSHSATNTLIFKSTNSGANWASVSVPSYFSTYLGGWSSAGTSGNETIFFPKRAGMLTKALKVDGSGATDETVSNDPGYSVCAGAYDEENSRYVGFSTNGTDTRVHLRTSGTWSPTQVATISNFVVDEAVCTSGVVVILGTPGSYENSDTSSTPREIWYAFSDALDTWYYTSAGPLDASIAAFLRAGPHSAAWFSDLEIRASGHAGLLVRASP